MSCFVVIHQTCVGISSKTLPIFAIDSWQVSESGVQTGESFVLDSAWGVNFSSARAHPITAKCWHSRTKWYNDTKPHQDIHRKAWQRHAEPWKGHAVSTTRSPSQEIDGFMLWFPWCHPSIIMSSDGPSNPPRAAVECREGQQFPDDGWLLFMTVYDRYVSSATSIHRQWFAITTIDCQPSPDILSCFDQHFYWEIIIVPTIIHRQTM